MTKSERTRIDYMPGSAALEALGLAAANHPVSHTENKPPFSSYSNWARANSKALH